MNKLLWTYSRHQTQQSHDLCLLHKYFLCLQNKNIKYFLIFKKNKQENKIHKIAIHVFTYLYMHMYVHRFPLSVPTVRNTIYRVTKYSTQELVCLNFLRLLSECWSAFCLAYHLISVNLGELSQTFTVGYSV